MSAAFDQLRFHCAQSPVELVRIPLTGHDATAFLHGQSTNAVADLPRGGIRLQAFTDRVGKLECYFWAARETDSWALLVPPPFEALLRQRFERFVVSEDAELGPSVVEQWWLAIGPSSPSGTFTGELGGERAAWNLSPWANVDKISAELRDDFLAWQGEAPFHPTGEPQLINQTLLFRAVDLRKGCFPGQETVAKIHNNRGAAWAPALLRSETPGFPPVLMFDGKPVARVLAQEGTWAQAELLRDVRVDGLRLTVEERRYEVRLHPRFETSAPAKAAEAYHRGTEAFGHGDETAAMAWWETAVDLDPSHADTHEAMGVLLGRQDRLDEAIARMRHLLTVDPASVMAHTNLSLFLMRQGKIEEAESHKALATVATFQRFGAEAKAKREVAEQQERALRELADRERMFRQVLDIDPEDALANYGLAGIFHERGDHRGARDALEKVLASDPRYSVAYLLLGKVLIALGETARAQTVLDEGIRVAAQKGDMMPANEMQGLRLTLG